MTASWGTSPWGTGAYGIAPFLTVDGAVATSTRSVLVTLSKPPQDVSPFLIGDVRNPASWLIQRLDTNEALIIADIQPYNRPLQWLITTLSQFPNSMVEMRVTAVGLKDAGGSFVQLPRSADFLGVTEAALSTPTQLAAARRVVNRDLTNLPTASLTEGSSVGGVLQISGGDYTLMSGPPLVKKLIIRRLLSTPGDFFHLPQYGAGLRVKEPIPSGDLIKLKTSITNQVLQEPDISQATVSLEQSANLLTVKVKAVIFGTGQEVNVSINSQIGQG